MIRCQISFYYPNEGPRPPIDIEHDRCDRKTCEMATTTSDLYSKVSHGSGVKCQAADALSRVPMTWMDESLFEEDVSGLTITKEHREKEKSKKDSKYLQRLPGNESLDTMEPAWPEAIPVANEPDKKDCLRQPNSLLNRWMTAPVEKLSYWRPIGIRLLIRPGWSLDHTGQKRWGTAKGRTHVIAFAHTVLGALSCPRWSPGRGTTLWYFAMRILLALYGQRCIRYVSLLPLLRSAG